jgi:hypothetical protein
MHKKQFLPSNKIRKILAKREKKTIRSRMPFYRFDSYLSGEFRKRLHDTGHIGFRDRKR